MRETIERLLILQDRDRKIRRLQGELDRIEPERESLKAKAAAAQAGLESAKTRLKQLESSRKDLELEVEAKKEQINRYANQQLQTRKNEEYRALAHEIETCKQAIFKVENQEIEVMEQAEAAQKEIGRATEAAGGARKIADEQVTQLEARERSLKQELSELEANRAELASAVDEVARGRYDRLARNKGENVVVGVQHGVCGGCHMKLPPQLLVMCQAASELVTCSNCGRILYYTRDMDLATVD
jgi:predicted  nucleic acid-binding Zn-ribbon protein